MANLRMTLLDLINRDAQGADPSFRCDGVKLLAQELMEAEATELAGAGLPERGQGRLTYRNGYRDREWDTRVGTIDLQIPKLRAGSYFPSLLEPRRRHERALLSVVRKAYINGVSTRAIDQLAEALGLKGISKDQVSRICREVDGQVTAFRTRRLDAECPYRMLDATFEKVRGNGSAISMAVLIAVGVRRTGEREVLAVDVGPAEDHEFWKAFLRQLLERGLRGVSKRSGRALSVVTSPAIEYLSRHRLGRLVTVESHGQPHVVPPAFATKPEQDAIGPHAEDRRAARFRPRRQSPPARTHL